MKAEIKSLNGKWEYLLDPDSKFSCGEIEKLISGKTTPLIPIPSNWQLRGLNNYNGSIWFKRRFKFSEADAHLSLLEFNGADYFTDAWLNGIYLGNHEGYFQKFYFDISDKLNRGEFNTLIIRVNSPFEEPEKTWPLKKRLIKGIFNHHDCRPGGWNLLRGQDQNTGGIWNDVNLISGSDVFITNIRVETKLNKNLTRAKIIVRADYISKISEPGNDEIKITLITPDNKSLIHQKRIYIRKNNSSFVFSFDLNDPMLWWTWDLGDQNLYKLSLESGHVLFTEETFGIREVSLDVENKFYLNRKRLFLRGTNIIPAQFLSELDQKKIADQIRWIKEANLNIVRMHAHVNRKQYYYQCDKAGVLVWQDFALQWTYENSDEFTSNAVNQIKDMVRLLFNHPSVAFWCCHNEPGEQAETLDPFLYDAVFSVDTSRIIRLASNHEEHPYDGWYWGSMEHFAACPMGPLVTEFGAQALPHITSMKKFMSDREINKPDWDKWQYHNFQYEQTFHIAKIDKGRNTAEFVENSQNYQARYIRTAIDFYRREKYQKVNALFQFMFIDCWPSITWSVIDYYGKKKSGFFALKKAMQPVYISVKVMRNIYFPGQKLLLDIWIVNDLHENFIDCCIELVFGKKILARMSVDFIAEDSVKRFFWGNNDFYLPKNIIAGSHKLEFLLKDKSNNIISVNDIEFTVVRKN